MLARALSRSKLVEAAELQRHVVAVQKRVLGASHRDTLATMNHLALTLDDLHELAEAETLDREILKRQRETLGDSHPHVIISIGNLARVLHDLGKREEADELFLEAIDGAEAGGIPTSATRLTFAQCLLADARLDDAETQLIAAEHELRTVEPDRRDRMQRVLALLVRIHRSRHDDERAESLERELRELERNPIGSAGR
ncbi:MAG: tetratricopeptide repeat protein [Planctomycetota bacterium]